MWWAAGKPCASSSHLDGSQVSEKEREEPGAIIEREGLLPVAGGQGVSRPALHS